MRGASVGDAPLKPNLNSDDEFVSPNCLSPQEQSDFHAALREQNRSMVVWTAAVFNIFYLAWSGFDYLLAPHEWLFFLKLRISAVIINAMAAVLVMHPGLRYRTWEALWVIAVSFGGFIGPMLPLSGNHLSSYLMGFSIVIFGTGVLPLWPPLWVVTSLAAMLASIAFSFLILPNTINTEDFIGGIFVISTAVGLSIAATVFRFQLLKNDFAANISLSRLTQQLQTANDRLEILAITDSLTALHNRRFINEALEREVERAKRYHRPLACLMADIDHFKKINDTFGHQIGDQILILVAQALSGSVRAMDIIGRYGGEEFLFLAPETDPAAAVMLAELLRLRVAEASRRSSDFLPPVTISVGVAAMDSSALVTANELVRQADAALYLAKARGRNQVAVYEG